MEDGDFHRAVLAIRGHSLTADQGNELIKLVQAAMMAKPTASIIPKTLADAGWAPGFYMVRCADCPPGLSFGNCDLGEKRSWRCQKHAQEYLDSFK